jgi:hypothetical protein
MRRITKQQYIYIGKGLIEAAIVYGLGLWAIDSGSIWLWLAVVVMTVGVVQNFVRAIASAVSSK